MSIFIFNTAHRGALIIAHCSYKIKFFLQKYPLFLALSHNFSTTTYTPYFPITPTSSINTPKAAQNKGCTQKLYLTRHPLCVKFPPVCGL